MTIKSDDWISSNSLLGTELITPFEISIKNSIIFNGKKINVPSYGLSSYGYDVRLGSNFKFFKSKEPVNIRYSKLIEGGHVEYKGTIKSANNLANDNVIDIADFTNTCEIQEFNNLTSLILPPHSFCLGHSVELIQIPERITAVCMGKSSVARTGILVTVTPLECEWRGHVTLEITNPTNLPIRIYPGMGITQLQFFESDAKCRVSYADRNGKYQDQGPYPIEPR